MGTILFIMNGNVCGKNEMDGISQRGRMKSSCLCLGKSV